MADSIVDICNGALAFLGDYTISSLDEENKQARACAYWYPKVRRMVLEEHDWNCAKAQARLSKEAQAPLYGYAFSYALPTGFIRARRLSDPDAVYEIHGKSLYTDVDGAILLYIRDVEDTTFFSPLLSDCISMGLAAKVAFNLTGDGGVAANVAGMFERQLSKAKGSDSAMDSTQTYVPDEWLAARF